MKSTKLIIEFLRGFAVESEAEKNLEKGTMEKAISETLNSFMLDAATRLEEYDEALRNKWQTKPEPSRLEIASIIMAQNAWSPDVALKAADALIASSKEVHP